MVSIVGFDQSRSIWTLVFLLVSMAITGCEGSEADVHDLIAPLVELEEFETIVAYEDNLLARPSLLHFDRKSGNLFVYDYDQYTLFEINRIGDVLNEFGGEGGGPGELAGARNVFMNENEVYIQDHLRFFIHRYTRNGNFTDSFDYGAQRSFSSDRPPPPPSPPIPPDFYNQPFVTGQGQVILPEFENEEFLYQLQNWESEQLARIGERPDEYIVTIDDNTHRSYITSQTVPPTERHRTFLVDIPSEPGEFFIIYSNENLITRYNRNGEKLWERELPETPELSQVQEDYYLLLEGIQPGRRFPLRRYVHGAVSPENELYLTTYTNMYSPIEEKRPLFVHRFSSDGQILERYKLGSDDENNLAIQIGVDFENRVFYAIVLESGEVRAYPY
ncbi:MAG: hypothetical protein WEA36_07010 [Balneolaceae bacterium]